MRKIFLAPNIFFMRDTYNRFGPFYLISNQAVDGGEVELLGVGWIVTLPKTSLRQCAANFNLSDACLKTPQMPNHSFNPSFLHINRKYPLKKMGTSLIYYFFFIMRQSLPIRNYSWYHSEKTIHSLSYIKWLQFVERFQSISNLRNKYLLKTPYFHVYLRIILLFIMSNKTFISKV